MGVVGEKTGKVRLRAPDHEGLGCYFKKFRFYSVALILADERQNQMSEISVVKSVVIEGLGKDKLGI